MISSRATSVPETNSRSVKRRVSAFATVTAGGSTSRGASASAFAGGALQAGRGGAPHLSSGSSGGVAGAEAPLRIEAACAERGDERAR